MTHSDEIRSAFDSTVNSYVDGQIGAARAASSAEIASVRSQLAQAQKDLNAANALTGSQGAEIGKLKTRVTELEAQLAEREEPEPVDPASLPYWGKPVWRDEFDVAGIDTTKWNARNDVALSYDQAVVYSANNVIPGDGFLHSKINRITPVTRSGRTRYFSTGYLDTIGKFAQRYGRWEMRAKLPLTPGQSKGFWPAFWLRDSTGTGECDVMEAIGTPHTKESVHPEGITSMTMHQDTGHAAGTVKIEKKPTQSEVYLADGKFHTFAVEWTREGFRFLVDGVERWFPKTAQYPWFESSFPGGVNIRLNCQVGDSWMGFYDPATPGTSVTPAEMTVEYVRVWALPSA